MKFLIRFFIFLSILCSFAFCESVTLYNDVNLNGYGLKPYDIKFLKGNSLIGVRYINYGSLNEYRVYRFRFDHDYYSGSKYSPGFYLGSGGSIYYFGADKVSNHLYLEMSTWSYDVYSVSNNPNHPFFTYSSFLSFHTDGVVATCGVNQEFDTETNKCVDPCPAGQNWDVDIDACVNDCTDASVNKLGIFNGTTQGGCIDCSSVYSDDGIASCLCTGLGSSFSGSHVFLYDNEKPGILHASCDNGASIVFKHRVDEDPNKDKKKDNNSTNSSDKDKENPKPDKDKDKKNDSNSTNSSNKDNNENSNNSSGESGNPSNNNSGGSAGNGSSGGGGSGVEIKPNPNSGNGKEDGKGDGNQDGKGEEGKGDDAVAQKLDYGDLEKDSDKFNSDFKDALDSVISQAQDFKNSLNDTISKIKEGGLGKFNQSAISNTCPLTFNVDFSFFRKDLTFDICKVIAPASQTLYYFFYVVFFVLFLIVTIKLFLFTF